MPPLFRNSETNTDKTAASSIFSSRQFTRSIVGLGLDEALSLIRAELRESREVEKRRQRDDAFFRRLERRPAKSDSMLVDIATGLAPAAVVLLLAYVAGKKGPPPVLKAGAGEADSSGPGSAATDSPGGQGDDEQRERALIAKAENGTATEEDIRALGALMWRKLQTGH